MDGDLNIPFFSWLVEIDKPMQFRMWCLIRVVMALTITKNMLQADQWWQSTEIAYTLVYGTQNPGVHHHLHTKHGTAVPTNQPLPWEWR